MCATRLLPLVVLLVSSFGAPAKAVERPLKVVGSTSLQAQVARSADGRLRLDGKLTDDAGAAVAEGVIHMTLPPGDHRVRLCGSGEVFAPGTGFDLKTDGQGGFCAELDAELAGSRLRLDFADAAGLLGGARIELDVAPAPLRLDLRLTTASELQLDTPVHVVEVAVVPRRDTAEAPPAEPDDASARWAPLRIELGLEAPHRERQPLGDVLVHPGERGRLEVPAERLGAPGTAVLVARFDGNETWAPAEARHHVSKTAGVTLDVPAEVTRSDVTPPVELPVSVRWSRGPVLSGSVEAFAASRPLGTAPVVDGEARLILTFQSEVLAQIENAGEGARRVPLTLVYVPNAPWWRAGAPGSVELTLAEPSLWTKLSWLFAALTVLIWVALIWRRPARRTLRRAHQTPDPPGKEHFVVIDADGDDLSGHVFDAHTGNTVADALLQVVLPGVQGRAIVASARTDAAGCFVLPSGTNRTDGHDASLQLHVSAIGYAALERPLPRRGRLIVHLVTLRRAVVDRLLQWAHRKGPPWSGRVPPTPEHIAQTAESRREAPTAHWARRVEAAAYGPEPPDEALHRDLREAEPP